MLQQVWVKFVRQDMHWVLIVTLIPSSVAAAC